MYAVGVFNDLGNIVGKGVLLFVQGIHLEHAVALAGYAVVVPPRELGDENLFVVTLAQEIMDGVLQHILATVGQQHLLLGNTVNLADTYTDHTLFTLIVDTGVETEILWIEVFHSVKHFLAWLEIKFVSIKIIHFLLILLLYSLQRYE